MYFLGFPVYRLDQTLNSVSYCCYGSPCRFFIYILRTFFHSNLTFFLFNFPATMFHQMAAAKDPDVAFFKKLDGFQPCEITELKAGNHFFAVYGQFRLLLQLQQMKKQPPPVSCAFCFLQC